MKIYADPGTEGYIKFGKNCLSRLNHLRADLRLPVLRKYWQIDATTRVDVTSSEYGDTIRITGALPFHALLGMGNLRFLSTDGGLLASFTAVGNLQLLGMSGGGGYTFVLGDAEFDTRVLYVFRGTTLYQTLTYTFPVGTTATYTGSPYDGFINGGVLISYGGRRAVIPVSLEASGGQGVLIFDDTQTGDDKLRYFITPPMLDINTFETPYIATMDLSHWGWNDYQIDAPDADTVFHSMNFSTDVETQVVIAHTFPGRAAWSQNGTLVMDYASYVTGNRVLNIGGVVYAYSNAVGVTRGFSGYPWLMSADASKVILTASSGVDPDYLFSSGTITAFATERVMCVSSDGSTYATYDPTLTAGVTVVRGVDSYVIPGFWTGYSAPVNSRRPVRVGHGGSFVPHGLFSPDGTVLRQAGYSLNSNIQRTYRLVDSYIESSVTFAYGGNQYDNAYTRLPLA